MVATTEINRITDILSDSTPKISFWHKFSESCDIFYEEVLEPKCYVLEKMGITGYSADPMFAKALTFELKKMGYDGVVSDDKIEGLVIFDDKKVKKVK